MKSWKIVLVILSLFIFLVLIFSNFFTNPSTNPLANLPLQIKFFFIINDTNESIDGEVFFDNISIGNTSSGIINIPSMNATPKELEFKGIYLGKPFEIYYAFPEDYLDYAENSFIMSISEIEYAQLIQRDMFPNANFDKLRWNHMPLVYNYVSKDKCGIARVDKLNYAFNEINTETNNSVYFIEGKNPDILITCLASESDRGYDSGYSTQILGEGGPSYTWGHIILNATLNFYPTMDGCGYFPFVEIHEILHTLGYEQNLYGQWHYPYQANLCTLMGNYTACDNYKNICGNPHIDSEIILDLMQIYKK